MKHAMFSLALVLVAVGVAAQPAPAGPAEVGKQQRQAERMRIASARAAAEARYRDQERACWQRFAVNDCLRDAARERRAMLDRLRDEELVLNAREREARTTERLHAIEQKANRSD